MPELMKGNVWHKRKHLVKYPVFAEVKHDEIRCHVRIANGNVEFLSYAGNNLANMERFTSLFLTVASNSGHIEFDCGFEVNENFGDSYRWVRSTRGVPADLIDASFKFFLFDLPNDPDGFALRRPRIVEIAKRNGLHYVHGEICCNEQDVDNTFKSYREKGYEGAMIKSSNHLYMRGKRIDGWLKMKPENDASGIIVGIKQAFSEDGVALGRAGSVEVALADKSEASPHGIAHELGRDMWLHPEKYIGETCDFKYMERDRQGGYRHPVFHRLREAV